MSNGLSTSEPATEQTDTAPGSPSPSADPAAALSVEAASFFPPGQSPDSKPASPADSVTQASNGDSNGVLDSTLDASSEGEAEMASLAPAEAASPASNCHVDGASKTAADISSEAIGMNGTSGDKSVALPEESQKHEVAESSSVTA